MAKSGKLVGRENLMLAIEAKVKQFERKLDEHQKQYFHSIYNYKVVMVDAPAGTGKTTIAVMAGLQLLTEEKIKKITYVRFPDSRGQKLGALPGDAGEKEDIYMLPFYDAAGEFGLSQYDVQALQDYGMIELTTDIKLRGRTLKDQITIVDECQNGSIEDQQLVFTRIVDESGCLVAIGHSGQMDNKLTRYGSAKLSPFQVYQKHMNKKHWTYLAELKTNYRGKIAQWADLIQETINELDKT